MIRATGSRRVSVLYGAIKWLPVVAVPFGVFFFETWLQVRIYENDYATTKLKAKVREITSHIGRLQEHSDDLLAIKRLSEKAPDLGLVPIEPGQVEVLYAPERAPAEPAPYVWDEPIAIADAAPVPAPRPVQKDPRHVAP